MPESESSLLSWSRVFHPLGEKMSAQLAGALIGLQLDADAQRRFEELAAKNTEGQLSEEERVELSEFAALNRMVSILKVEASLTLQGRVAA